ncbi:MAG: hypothetical protein M1812_006832 [Candelaria pacifica]|nr:MAG: hypothetical protein M1812_006832 [Candelaria pacifica]
MSVDRKQATSAIPQQHVPASTFEYPIASASDKPITLLELYSTRVPQPYVTGFCGAAGGFTSGIVTCPLDVIKTKLQAQGGFQQRKNGSSIKNTAAYRGMVGTARVIWREEGLRGMYRGLGPIILGYVPTWAVYLTVYSHARDFFYTKTDKRWLAHTYSSVIAGGCSTMVTNPIWVIKTRLMSQISAQAANSDARPPWHYKSTMDAARKMYHNEGVLAFYSGLTPALLGLTHVAVQFPLYEYFKMRFTGQAMGERSEDSSGTQWFAILAATLLSKVCASSATYPHEVIRTRLQTQQRSLPNGSPEGISFRGGLEKVHNHEQPAGASSSDGMRNLPRYRGIIKTCQTILREEGWTAFYAGLGTNMIRAVPAAATTMLTYEYLKGYISGLQYEGNRKLGPQR